MADPEITLAVFREGDTVDVVLHNKQAKRQLALTFEDGCMRLTTIDENMKRKEDRYLLDHDVRDAFLWLVEDES